jgi:hypothetical protein
VSQLELLDDHDVCYDMRMMLSQITACPFVVFETNHLARDNTLFNFRGFVKVLREERISSFAVIDQKRFKPKSKPLLPCAGLCLHGYLPR